MKSIVFVSILTFSTIFLISKTAKTQCHIDDWTALKALYENTDGDNWFNNDGWESLIANQVSPPANCNLEDLYGVFVDNSGRVSCLDMDGTNNCFWNFDGGNNLTGVLPSEMGLLIGLDYLYLQQNNLTSSIPPEMGNLINLKWLILSYNQLIGTLPAELANLSSLKLLEVENNELSGCYNSMLSLFLCNQLNDPKFGGNIHISNGNYFNASWQEFCNTGSGVCLDFELPPTVNVWPGDVNYDGIVNDVDISIHYLFNGENGEQRSQQGISWQAYPALDWETPQPNGHDIKHFDCDGNGFINTQDINAIILNNGLTHTAGISNPNILSSGDLSMYGTNYQIYLRPANQVNTEELVMDIVLESLDGRQLYLFGGYFSIDYENTNTSITNATIDINESWLGSPNVDLISEFTNYPKNKKVEVGFSKTNGRASLGSGIIGQVIFLIDNSSFKTKPNNQQVINFKVNKIGAHDTRGNMLPIEDKEYAVIISDIPCPANLTINKNTPFQNLYNSSGTIATNGNLLISQNQKIEYKANHIRLNNGFCVKPGANFKARFGDCSRNGLIATYYDNIDFTGSSIVRLDSTINFNWGDDSPLANIDGNTFSVRWEGFVETPTSGTYTFFTTTDDGVRLWINNQLVIDHWVDQIPTEIQGVIPMTAGQKVSIKMEYYENGGGAVAQLRWEGPEIDKQIIPNDYLFTE